MARIGKIARLSVKVRNELNERLENGAPGRKVLLWLNGLAEVQESLKEEIEGKE